ncbi:tetratricopeptide repeat protein [Stenotrophomonas humi]
MYTAATGAGLPNDICDGSAAFFLYLKSEKDQEMDVETVTSVARSSMMAALVMVGLVGCASAPSKNREVSFETTMEIAEAQVSVAGSDVAIKAFEDAAKVDPTRKEPWVRIAQLQFDQGQYARAIVAAEEVLQRDSDDLVADGVLTVAGFRVANHSLERLEGRGALSSETAQKEAKALANMLRSTMGQAILEPEKPKVRARQTRGSTARRATVAPPVAPARRRSGADPFQNIGN